MTATGPGNRIFLLSSCAWLAAIAWAAAEIDLPPPAPGADSAFIAPLAARSLLLDAALAGTRIVAVGERGHILLSDDGGASWQQRPVPTRATLTGVDFVDERHGWAVGHDETILHTDDGGRTWTRQHVAIDSYRPLLAVRFHDATRGFAVGAYGLYLETEDGGATWRERNIQMEALSREPSSDTGEDDALAADAEEGAGLHFNQIARSRDGVLYLAGEAGSLWRSDDGGAHWLQLDSRYEGSFFGLLPLEADTVLVFGLRGHVFRSEDRGRSWTEVTTGTTETLTDGLQLPDGRVLIAGLGGVLLVGDSDAAEFEERAQEERLGVARVLPQSDGGVLLFGEGGARRLDVMTE